MHGKQLSSKYLDQGPARWLFGLLCLLSISLLCAGQAQAQRDPFEVHAVPVDVTAATASEARAEAVAVGQRTAFARLLRRLTFGGLPSDSVSDKDITGLVQGMEVMDERTSSVRYIAQLNIRFRRGAVRRFLFDRQVSFAETVSRPVLIIPVFISQGFAQLWEDTNPWREAWQNLPPQDGLVPLVVPYGDLADIRDLSPRQAIDADQERLAAIAERYRARDTVVAQAAVSIDVARNVAVLEITMARHGSARQSEVVVDTVEGETRDDLLGLLDAGVARMISQIEQSWKRDNLVRAGVETRVSALVPIQSFAGWLKLRRKLDQIAIVNRQELIRISKREALVDLWIQGDAEQLRIALAQRDLDLRPGPQDWYLLLRGVDLPERYTQQPKPAPTSQRVPVTTLIPPSGADTPVIAPKVSQ
jgi:hypothetical protein